ncbi:MAG: Crp/Fnr family transcriptional regulator [Arcicella sp.]|nr:Crp/Fnr family transcriptional regulator [Arcicella sp.]
MLPQLKDFFRFFIDFSEEELADVWEFFHPKKLKKGEFLYVPGDIATEMGFLVKGTCRVFYVIDEKETTRHLFSENTFVTSAPSFTTQKPCIEYVEAVENSDLLMLSYQNLQAMYEISPKWERFSRLVAEFAYNQQQKRIYSLIALTAHQRYEKFVKENPILTQRVPQYIIANYLGISPETLSRIRKN